MKKLNGVFWVGVWVGLLLSCRNDDETAVYSKTYQSEKAVVIVTVDKIYLNPADRCTVTVAFHHEDGLTPQLSWLAELPLSLIEQFQNPDKTVFRFDSDIPGTYTIPPLSIVFGRENPILTDAVTLTVYSETESGAPPEEILTIYEDQFDFYLLFLIVSLVVVLILLGVLIGLVVRYYSLRRKLKETVARKSVGILEALRTAVANHFDTLETDKAAVLILQSILIPFQDEMAMNLMIKSFSEETIRKLRTVMEKYQKVAFAQATVGQTEMLEDLNFFIGFQKEFDNYRMGENGQ